MELLISDSMMVFLAALSHELRTPLSGVSGAVALLQASGLNERQQEYARMISYANGTLLEIVDDMLDFSRIQAGKIRVDPAPFSIRAIIDDMLALQTIQAQVRGIVLIRDVAAQVPVTLRGDRGKLNQILLNIIGNAIKFTDEGTVTVSVDTQVGADAGKVRLVFTVTDTGIGLSPQHSQDVFEPFVQITDQPETRRGGTGLGLAICQRLVHAMNGDISFSSEYGQGSSVSFRLDMDVVAGTTETEPSISSMTDAMPEHCLTVLVVEDDEINRLVCTRYLALHGHHPLVAADGRQAVQIMQDVSYVPDVILMDMNLQGMTGVDLARRIATQQGGRYQQVPVIIMSADVSGAAQDFAMQAGMAAFLAKPFSAHGLSQALQQVMTPEAIARGANQASTSDSMEVGKFNQPGLLDDTYLTEEIEVLGMDTLLELLNIFRAGVATRISQMSSDAVRLDWNALVHGAHQLQGSAGNLGMIAVADQARALQTRVRGESELSFAQAMMWVTDLEHYCHLSCDALRARLLATRH
ncbi:response regulator [Alcaligenaceae bacterium]|nr:response regulator [Alcaligenaceae bacterium]